MAQATVLVASPSAIGRTPLASGSRVPAWPALAELSRRRTAITAAFEVIPTGLSRTSQPSIGSPRRLFAIGLADAVVRVVARRRQIALDLGTVQQLVDAARVIERGVEREGETRRVAQRHFAGELAAQIAGAARQPFDDLAGAAAAQRHDEGGGVLEVGAHAHFGNGHRRLLQRRVTQAAPLQNAGKGMAQLLADAQLALARLAVSLALVFHGLAPDSLSPPWRRERAWGRARYSARATSSISKHSMTSPT